MIRRAISFILAVILLTTSFSGVYAEEDVSKTILSSIKWMQSSAGEYDGGLLSQRHMLPVGNTLSDWTAFCFALNGIDDDYEGYLRDLEFYVEDCYEKNGFLESVKATEYHRIILTIYALGGDPTDFGEKPDGSRINLLADGTYDFHGDSLGRQGLNGWIYALITVDAKNTSVPGDAKFTREDMINEILLSQEPDGGFGLAAGASGADITAMAVQALAPYIQRDDVRTAVDRAVEYLSESMGEDGSFVSFGADSSETIAQIIIALSSIGCDPENDARFVKGGKNLLDHAMKYHCSDGGFAHSYGADESDFMATQQMLMAFTSLKNMREGKERIFDFTEYDKPEIIPVAENNGGFSAMYPISAVIIVAGVIVIMKIRGKKNV